MPTDIGATPAQLVASWKAPLIVLGIGRHR
jgi:hypothetical protein